MEQTSQAGAIAGVKAAAKPQLWRVLDPLAESGKTREHEIIIKAFDDGREPIVKKYQLPCDDGGDAPGCAMPMEHALKFLSDPVFVVIASDGKRVTPPPRIERGTAGAALPDDQTIAQWDELTTSALFKRCQIAPGGDRITTTSTRTDMIAFVLGWRKAQNAGPAGIAEEFSEHLAQNDTVAGQASNAQLISLFGEENPLLAQLESQGSPSVT